MDEDERDGVWLRAYDAAGKLLMEQFYGIGDWYDGHHPLLDDEDQVRVLYRVRRIEMQETGPGADRLGAYNLYDEAGALVRHVRRNPDRTETERSLSASPPGQVS